MDALVFLVLGLLIGASVGAAFMSVRLREQAQQVEAAEERLRDAEKRVKEADQARLAVQAHFQGVQDAEAERDRLLAEAAGLHRQLLIQQEQHRAADAELAEVQRRLAGLKAELASVSEVARRPMSPLSPNGLADRPEAAR